jgi:hypothetical protein
MTQRGVKKRLVGRDECWKRKKVEGMYGYI